MKKLLFLLGLVNIGYAGGPLWTLTPLNPTTFSVPSNGTAVVLYKVTNQSKKTHSLVVNTLPGITQDTSGSYCKSPFILAYQQSCTLKLNITGSQLQGSIEAGPKVCEQASQGF